MEPYRSTLATTAVAVLGLVTAAHVLHPSYFEHPPRPARSVAATAEQAAPPVAWVDLPAERHVVTRPEMSSDTAALLAPRLTAALPLDATMTPPLASAMAAPSAQARDDEAVRRRAAQRAVRSRQAARARAMPIAPAASAAEGQGRASQQVKADPLSDLLRSLGLGRDG